MVDTTNQGESCWTAGQKGTALESSHTPGAILTKSPSFEIQQGDLGHHAFYIIYMPSKVLIEQLGVANGIIELHHGVLALRAMFFV